MDIKISTDKHVKHKQLATSAGPRPWPKAP